MKKFIPYAVGLFFAATLFAEGNMDFSDEAFFPEPTESSVENADSEQDFGFADFQSTESDFGFSDEDLFGSSDDDFFEDDGIEEMVVLDEKSSALAKGTLFEIGSVRVGGAFDLGLSTYTALYRDDNHSFWDRVKDSRLSPSAGASLFVDARPTSTLRLYTKFGIKFPYSDQISMKTSSSSVDLDKDTQDTISDWLNGLDVSSLDISSFPSFSITNWLYLKELFTDFSIADRAFFRFGLHTVSWGAGFFFSPVSDMINTSSIDPENTDAQVDGSLNLRTQITFPGSQNCLWLYVVPSMKSVMPSMSSQQDLDNLTLNEYLDDAMFPYLLKETAFAGKMDVVISNWELGFGGVFKYSSAPKIMATATGSIINGKVGVFGEAVLSYGSQAQWDKSTEWKNKDLIFQGTVGAMYMWSDPGITFMAQYYFDGNKGDHEYSTYGNNIAATVNFSKIGNTDLTATIFGLFYLGKTNVSTLTEAVERLASGDAFMPYAGIVSATLTWTPFTVLKISGGPYITWLDMTKAPEVALKFGVTLGGGKF